MENNSPVRDKIIEILDQRNRKGMETYGVSIDECDPPTGCWKMEMIEELTDALQYAIRQILALEDEVRNKIDVIDTLNDEIEYKHDFIRRVTGDRRLHSVKEMRDQYKNRIDDLEEIVDEYEARILQEILDGNLESREEDERIIRERLEKFVGKTE